MEINFIVYFNYSTQRRIYNYIKKTFLTVDIDKTPPLSQFYLPSSMQKTDENLIIYATQLLHDSTEIYNYFSNHKNPFNYIGYFQYRDGKKGYRTHDSNIEAFWKITRDKEKYDKLELKKIDKIEAFWIEQTYNAGLIYSIKDTCMSYGYDKSNYYGSLMSSDKFMIPIKAGEERILKVLPLTKIKYGFYKVLIVSNDITVKKLFAFSSSNTYTHFSLKHALELQKTYKIDITLIENGQCNQMHIYIY